MLRMHLGRTARMVADDIPQEVVTNGCRVDFGDGHGVRPMRGTEATIYTLMMDFPEDRMTKMLRTAHQFFLFQPIRGECLETMCIRFDTLIDRTNKVAGIEINWVFRSWILMSIMRRGVDQ